MELHRGSGSAPYGSEIRVDGYEILSRIGTGGSSTVYRATQLSLEREVALKVLHLDLEDERARHRFKRECVALGKLSSHQNIVSVHDAGATRDGRAYIAMDICEEGSLHGRLEARGPLRVDETLNIGVQLAGALESAHLAGIFHRDIKPSNVLITSDGKPAFTDFGIALVGDARPVVTHAYSPEHAAPEVLQGLSTGGEEAADIYGLASTLFELLAGRPAFPAQPADGPLSQAHRVASTPTPHLLAEGVSIELDQVIQQAMSKNPSKRPATALELGQRLAEIQRSLNLPVTSFTVLRDSKIVGPIAPVAAGGKADSTYTEPGTGLSNSTDASEPFSHPISVPGAAIPAPHTILVDEPAPADPPIEALRRPGYERGVRRLVIVGILIVAVIGAVWFWISHSPGGGPPVTSSNSTRTPPAANSSLIPRRVTVTAAGSATSVLVRWAPPVQGSPAYVVTWSPATPNGLSRALVQIGVTMATVDGANDHLRRCFVVTAVYGDGSTATAPSVCRSS